MAAMIVTVMIVRSSADKERRSTTVSMVETSTTSSEPSIPKRENAMPDRGSDRAPKADQASAGAAGPTPIAARRTLPMPPLNEDDSSSDAAALSALAGAWSTGVGLAKAVVPKGLSVAVADGPATMLTPQMLTELRDKNPVFATADCPEAKVSMVFGEPFLEAYYGLEAQIRPWPADDAAWSEHRCYGLSSDPEAPAVRVCIADDEGEPKVAMMQVGLTDRPKSTETIARAPQRSSKVVPSTNSEAVEDRGEAPARYNVVRLASGEVLAARLQADPTSAVVHSFDAEARSIAGTGASTKVDDAVWVQLETPAGPGWVDRRFVSRVISTADMAKDGRFRNAMDALLQTVVSEAPSRRDLYFMHYDEPLKWSTDGGDLAVSKSRKWSGPACKNCIEGTMREVLGGALTDVLHDADAVTAVGELRSGPNRSWLIPVEFSGFNVISIYDPQDTDCGGYDWMSAAFFFDEQDGSPALIAVGFDAWSP
ncbi:MAG: hypothetical protein AAFV29_06105 [Myxococcota bacterium]